MSTSIFTVSHWEEAFNQGETMAHAKASYHITGDFEGDIAVDYSIFYLDYCKEEVHQSSSMFSGFLLFTGSYKGKTGTLAFKDDGSFVNGIYQNSLSIIKGTGTGELSGMTGSGSYSPTEKGMVVTLHVND